MTTTTTITATTFLYGPHGWTLTSGVSHLLAPIECEPRLCENFVRFSGLKEPEARALIDILPEANLHDRQNNGPELAELLHTAITCEGVELSGYMVGPPRPDERVSVDGLFAPPGIGLPLASPHDPFPFAHWPTVRDVLNLKTATAPPDEFLPVSTGRDSECGWWMWWD